MSAGLPRRPGRRSGGQRSPTSVATLISPPICRVYSPAGSVTKSWASAAGSSAGSTPHWTEPTIGRSAGDSGICTPPRLTTPPTSLDLQARPQPPTRQQSRRRSARPERPAPRGNASFGSQLVAALNPYHGGQQRLVAPGSVVPYQIGRAHV